MDCSLPGSSVHGIVQARVLEWGAIAFSKYQWNQFKRRVIIFWAFLLLYKQKTGMKAHLPDAPPAVLCLAPLIPVKHFKTTQHSIRSQCHTETSAKPYQLEKQ